MPIVDAGDNNGQGNNGNGGNHNDGGSGEEPPGNDKKKKKKSKTKKVFLIILLLFLVIGGGIAAAFTFIPDWLHVDEVSVPDVVGEDYHDAKDLLEEKNLQVDSEEVSNDEFNEDQVARQDPKADTTVKEGTTVQLFVSSGAETIKLDSYLDK